jgi:hypothetical protein
MAWPSGTKASTANVDQGGDKISLARPDIKQNIDNVNDIIDHLNISSPSDGDLLQYSSSSGKWEQVASTSVGNNTAIFEMANVNNQSGLDYFWAIDTIHYNAGFLTNNSDSAGGYNFTLTAGTYAVQLMNPIGIGEGAVDTIYLYNNTDSTNEVTFNRVTSGSVEIRSAVYAVFTIASTKEYKFQIVGDVTGISGSWIFKFEKLA